LTAFPGLEEYPETDNNHKDYTGLFDAPDYSSFIKHSQSGEAKEYTVKIESMIKGGVQLCLKNGNIPDAAALLKYGKEFAEAAGDLSDASPLAAKALDILTAPDNPYFTFALTGSALLFQLLRNHQTEVDQVKMGWKQKRALRRQQKFTGEYVKPEGRKIKVRLPFGRSFTLNVRIHVPVFSSAYRVLSSQTVAPRALADEVFSDKKLRTLLRQRGFPIRVTTREGADVPEDV